MQFFYHFNGISTLQLINGIYNDLQKLLKYFSGTTIFATFLFVIKLDLYLKDDKLFGICWGITVKSTSTSISSLLNCHKLPDYQNNYHYTQVNYTYALQY